MVSARTPLPLLICWFKLNKNVGICSKQNGNLLILIATNGLEAKTRTLNGRAIFARLCWHLNRCHTHNNTIASCSVCDDWRYCCSLTVCCSLKHGKCQREQYRHRRRRIITQKWCKVQIIWISNSCWEVIGHSSSHNSFLIVISSNRLISRNKFCLCVRYKFLYLFGYHRDW